MHACMHAHFCFLLHRDPPFERFTQAFTVWPTSWPNAERPTPNHFEHLLVVWLLGNIGEKWCALETHPSPPEVLDGGLLHSARGVRQERGLAVTVVAIPVVGRRPLLVAVLRHVVICIIVAGGRRGCRLLYRLPNLFRCRFRVRELATTSDLLLGFGVHGGRRLGLLWAGFARA